MMVVIVGTFVLCWLPFALMFFLAPIRCCTLFQSSPRNIIISNKK
jgi:hypothetical protein